MFLKVFSILTLCVWACAAKEPNADPPKPKTSLTNATTPISTTIPVPIDAYTINHLEIIIKSATLLDPLAAEYSKIFVFIVYTNDSGMMVVTDHWSVVRNG